MTIEVAKTKSRVKLKTSAPGFGLTTGRLSCSFGSLPCSLMYQTAATTGCCHLAVQEKVADVVTPTVAVPTCEIDATGASPAVAGSAVAAIPPSTRGRARAAATTCRSRGWRGAGASGAPRCDGCAWLSSWGMGPRRPRPPLLTL